MAMEYLAPLYLSVFQHLKGSLDHLSDISQAREMTFTNDVSSERGEERVIEKITKVEMCVCVCVGGEGSLTKLISTMLL